MDQKSQTEYGVEDADITFQLKTLFEKELEDANTRKLFNENHLLLLIPETGLWEQILKNLVKLIYLKTYQLLNPACRNKLTARLIGSYF